MGRREPHLVQTHRRDRASPCTGFRPGLGGNAHQQEKQLPQRNLHRARHFARAARCAVPGALRSSGGGDGAIRAVTGDEVTGDWQDANPGKDGRLTQSSPPQPSALVVRRLGLADYEPTWRADAGVHHRAAIADTPDELWLVEHPPVYTLGIAAKPEHLPRIGQRHPGDQDRPGRADHLPRAGAGRDLCAAGSAPARAGRARAGADAGARGDRIAGGSWRSTQTAAKMRRACMWTDAKVAALGLRVRNGCCYHGLSLNVDMDLSPFRAINPCGYPGLQVTQLRDLGTRRTSRSRRATNLLAKLTAEI